MSFENLDYDEDGLLSASDVEKALLDYTDSKSPRLEAESMVRLFESGLREDNGGVSKSSLDVCLEPFWKSETSLKLVEYEQSQLTSVDESDGEGLPWWIAEQLQSQQQQSQQQEDEFHRLHRRGGKQQQQQQQQQRL